MSIGAVSSASTSPAVNNYLTSSTAPYQASPTNSNASSLPLTQVVGGSTDHTFTASVTDHELNAVNTPNPLGTAAGQTFGNNTQPDTLAQSGVGLFVSATT
jgi:dihydroorotate dehydrogenase